jgi:hypothetical protein
MLPLMMNKLFKNVMIVMLAAMIFCTSTVNVFATPTEETEEAAETNEANELTFEIAIFTYDIVPTAVQEDMPPGFTLGDW